MFSLLHIVFYMHAQIFNNILKFQIKVLHFRWALNNAHLFRQVCLYCDYCSWELTHIHAVALNHRNFNFPFASHSVSVTDHTQNDRVSRSSAHINIYWKKENEMSFASRKCGANFQELRGLYGCLLLNATFSIKNIWLYLIAETYN